MNNETKFIIVEPLSLKGKRKLRFFYYLYSYNHEAVKKKAEILNISESEVIRKLIEDKLDVL